MKKVDSETGNKERSIDFKMIMNLATVPTFNKKRGADFMGRLSSFINYMDLLLKD